MKQRLLIATLYLIPLLLSGQAHIQGVIQDHQTKEGIPFALIETSDQFQYTDAEGRFSFEYKTQDSIHLKVTQLGYTTQHYVFWPENHPLVLEMVANPIQMEEIMVSGSPHHAYPQSDIIANSTIQTTQPRDLGDLFTDIPGFSVVKRGGYALDPVFRGFKYEQLNIIYDGGLQTTHACPARMDPATTHVSPNEVSKIEILKGPFSVRYGASMGATINIVTESWDPNHPGFGGYVEGGYETNGKGKFTQLQLEQNKRLDWLLSASWKDYDNYRSGDGTEIPSSFRALDYSAKLGYDINPNQRIQVNWRQAAARDILHAGLAMDSDIDDTYILSLDYRWQHISPHLASLTAKVFGNQVDHVMSNLRRPNFKIMEAVANVQASNYGGRMEAEITPGNKSMIFTGIDWRQLHRSGDRNRLVKVNTMTGQPLPNPVSFTDPIWQDAGQKTIGFFGEDRYYLNNHWTLSAGARLDVVTSSALTPAKEITDLYGALKTDHEFNVSGTLAAVYEPDSDWQIQLAVGRGVRTGNLIERYINHFTVGADAYEYVGNPNLKPEANHQVELGMKTQKGLFSFEANVYGSYITDYISAIVDPSIPRKYAGTLPYSRRFVNIDKVIQSGFEWQSSFQLHDNLALLWNAAYVRAQNLDADQPIAEIPPLESTVGLHFSKTKWWSEGSIRMVAKQDRIASDFDESSTPAFQVVDLRAGWKPLSALSLGIGILNVFDVQYREHLNRIYRNLSEQGVIYEPGRNFTFFVKYDF